jgi:hypothetical protein
MAKVDTSAGWGKCWPWNGARDRQGYGVLSLPGVQSIRAPRWLLGHLRGRPLGVGEMALHRCDNAWCVNPAHLYIGDVRDNTRDTIARSPGSVIARKRAQTHCKNGHEYTAETTYVAPSTGHRQCRACANDRYVPEERHRRYLLTGK